MRISVLAVSVLGRGLPFMLRGVPLTFILIA